MLSDNPASAPAPLESRPPSRPEPAHALQPQVAIPDDGHASPRQHSERRTSTPGSPFQPRPHQQPQHGLNAPRPSLSPLSEYHSGFADEDLGSPCPSPAPSSSPFNLAGHRRQQSFPNLLPLALRSRTPSPIRKTHTRSPSEQMPYTGDGRAAAGSQRGSGGGLGSWLSGSAGAANALGLSPSSTNGAAKPAPDTPTRLRQSFPGPSTTTAAAATDPTTPKSNAASRFMSALSSRFTTPTTPSNPPPTTSSVNDDLSTLNLETALFPPSTTHDTFSPSSYKNLQMNALGLLTKLQTAYRTQAAELATLRAEQAAQRDELEEAVTRAQHLKFQLEGMARRAQEQEGEMRGLVEQLAAERGKRREAEAKAGMVGEGHEEVEEDLGVDGARRSRGRRAGVRKSWKSGSGVSNGEDGGMEMEETTEDESNESESVFSRCRSPGSSLAPLTASDGASVVAVEGLGAPMSKNAGGGNGSVNATPKQKAGQSMSAFQRILKGISGEYTGEDNGCSNCKGRDASAAWDMVGVLRDENRKLKVRMGELEIAVEGALDIVKGIGL